MNNRDKILEVALRRYNQKIMFVLEKKGIKRKETIEVLRELDLESPVSRSILVRELETELESLIKNNINTEEMSFVVRKLEKYINENYPKLNISSGVVKSFISSRYFETLNDMRAFKELCNGNLEMYNLFSGGSKELLMYAIIRVLALVMPSNVEVVNLEDIITSKFGGEGYDKNQSVYAKILKREMGKAGYLIKYYKERVDSSMLCFYDGVLNILDPVLKECGYEISSDKNKEVVDVNVEEIELIDSLLNETESCASAPTLSEVSLVKEESLEVEPAKEVVEEAKNEPISADDTKSECIEDEDDLTKLKKKVAECVDLIEKLEQEKSSINDVVLNSEIEELKIENARLRNENERLRVKAEGASLKSFIQKAGGIDANYQLSELYLLSEDMIEDDGNTVGRIINILTMLEGFGISAYFGGRQYLEEFEIERKELAKKYTLEMPLTGTNDVVKVKLIKNGWMQDGNIIVLPLVKQI